MATQRKLTPGEIALARTAFAGKIDYSCVILHDGPGNEPLAHIAFAKGNSAITVDSSIYFRADYCPDFSAPGRNRQVFIHEMTHVWQYQTMGLAAFALRYGADLLAAKGKPDAMYTYTPGTTRLGTAMLEAQAQMTCDYAAASWANDTKRLAKLAANLAGSGFYNL
jgi:type VI secretion system secreted protein VgrG